jgi:myosin heavy subunit
MAAAEGEAQTREELQRLLDEERRKNEVYQRALNEMRNQMGVQQSQTEAEAESITNKLIARIQEIEKDKVALRLQVEAEERRMKSEKTELEHKLQQNANHLSRLKHEKEVIVRQVEQEEEFLTNTLQQKLSKVLAEKIEIENDLEQEQEYISNRLQKQVTETLKEKHEMERRLEEEKVKVAAMEEEKKRLKLQLQALQVSIEFEEERISNRLGKTVKLVQSEKAVLMQQLEKEKAAAAALRAEHETQRQELKKLQGSNFVMQQRINRETSKLEGMKREKSYIAQRLEAEWEKHFNVMIRDKSRDVFGPFASRCDCLDEVSLPELDDDALYTYDPDDVGDVLGELSLTPKILQRRRLHKWESQSLPSFSPHLSPYPSPPATPLSSRSRSPAMTRSSRDSSRSQSPSARSGRSGTSSIVSTADTTSNAYGRSAFCKPSFGSVQAPLQPVHRGAGVLPPPPSSPLPLPLLTRSPSTTKSQH